MGVESAIRFWQGRGRTLDGPGAVVPRMRSAGYETWSRRKLQDWTLRKVVEHHGPRFRRVVDLGCGLGDWTARFAGLADRVTAVDVSAAFLEKTAARLAATGHPDWRVVEADVRVFDDYRGSDLVYAGGVLMYVDEPDVLDAYRRIRAGVSPDAVLCQRDWCVFNLGGEARFDSDASFSVHRRPLRYVAMAEAVGWRLVEARCSAHIYAGEWARARLSWTGKGAMSAASRVAEALFRAATLYWKACSWTFLFRPAT